MKTLRLVMYILYRHFSKGTADRTPYFSALCGVVFMIYMHIFQILIVLNKVDDVLPLKAGDDRFTKKWKLLLFLLPVFLVVTYLVKPKDLKKATYDEDKVRRGGIYLIIYIITSFVLWFVLAYVSAKVKRF